MLGNYYSLIRNTVADTKASYANDIGLYLATKSIKKKGGDQHVASLSVARNKYFRTSLLMTRYVETRRMFL
jgi:hypothetical protein